MMYHQILDACTHRVIDIKIIGDSDPCAHMIAPNIVGEVIRVEEPRFVLRLDDYGVHQFAVRATTRKVPFLPWRVIGDSVDHQEQLEFMSWIIDSISLPSHAST